MGTGCAPVDLLSDDALLAGFGSGEPALAVAFVRRFQRKLYGIALSVIGTDTRLAEDVTQRAFERAWRHAGVYDARRGSVGAWMARITRNLAIDAVRARRPAPVDPSEMDRLLEVVTWTPEQSALREESRSEVRAALSALPEAQARALLMATYRGMTAREIAEVEDIPLGTAKTRIRAGLTRLRVLLAPGERAAGAPVPSA